MRVPLAVKEQEQQLLYLLRRQIFGVTFHVRTYAIWSSFVRIKNYVRQCIH